MGCTVIYGWLCYSLEPPLSTCILIYILHSIPFTKVTDKKFAFAKKHGIPFEFVSAADGTNVVKVRIHRMLYI